jgi:ABC-type polysaccharide/polyol phosphate export permease
VEILRSLYKNRRLIVEMVRRDLVGRYMGSALGTFWSVLNPLVTLIIYTIVFSKVLNVRLGGVDGSVYSFVEYLFCGLLPWITIQESISRSAGCVLENANLVQKMRFPTEILPVNIVLSGFVQQLIGTAIFFIVLAAVGDLHYRWLMLLPCAFLLQLAATAGLCWLIASINVYFRDAGQVLGIVLSVWFWMTPIVYSKEKAPEYIQVVLGLNPWTHLVQIYRALVLEGAVPGIASWCMLSGFTTVAFALGLVVMKRAKPELADLI